MNLLMRECLLYLETFKEQKKIYVFWAVNQKIWQGSLYKIISVAIQRNPSFWLWHTTDDTYEKFVI